MKNVKILGTGCANCRNTIKLIEEVAAEKGIAVHLTKIEDLPQIMQYGVMSTPGVVVGISFFLLNNVFGYIGTLQSWWPWLAAAAIGLEPASPICTSPADRARTTSAPPPNWRQLIL